MMVETALFTLQEAAHLCGGRYEGSRQARPCRSVCIDSRDIRGEELFIPLKGESTDGHLHIGEALHRGAAGVLCRRDYFEEHRDDLAEKARGGAGFILVDDTLKAFWALAEGYLEGFSRLIRIGVTGSSGKTTTKELLGSVFSLFSPTVINEGNLNSETGLPLSVLNVRPEHRYGIFEMGINHPGEMEILSRIVKPQAAVITNIGTAHIGLLGSRAAIAEEKRGVFSHLEAEGAAFIHEDEEWADELTRGLEAEVVRFGPRTTEGFEGAENLGLHGWELRLFGRVVLFPLIGRFNLQNALCAVSVARHFGIDEMTVCSGLEQVRPLFGRGQVLHGKTTVMHDCYNANPDSLTEALLFLEALEWTGRKIAVLGAMKELGDETAPLHEMILRRAIDSGLDLVLFVGDEYHAAFTQAGCADRGGVDWFRDVDQLCERIEDAVGTGDLVLIKGSRGMALERITDYIV